MNDKTDTVQHAFDTMRGSTAQQWKMFELAVQNILVILGLQLLPVVNKVLQALRGVGMAIIGWLQAPGAMDNLKWALLGIAIIISGPIVAALSMAVIHAAPFLLVMTAMIAAGIWLGNVLRDHPAILQAVQTALGRLGAIAQDVAKHIGDLIGYIQTHQWVWDVLKTAVITLAIVIAVNLVGAAITAIPVLIGMAGAAWAAAIAFLAMEWPVLLLIAIVASLVFAGIQLVNHWSQVSAFFITVGKSLGAAFSALGTHVHDALSGVGQAVGGMFSAIGATIHGWLMGLAATFGAPLTLLMTRLGQLAPAILDLITLPWRMAAGALLAFWTGVLIPVATGIVLAILVPWKIVGGAVLAFWQTILLPFATFMGGLFVTMITNAWKLVTGAFGAAANWIGTVLHVLWNTVTGIFHGIASVISGVLQVILGVVTLVLSTISDVFTGHFNQIKADALVAWTTIVDGFKNIVGGLSAIAQNVWNGFTGIVKAAINGVIDVINTFINTVNGIKIQTPKIDLPGGNSIGGNTIGFPTIPDIPYLYAGGMVTHGGFVNVGDQGTEQVYIPTGGGVVPHNFEDVLVSAISRAGMRGGGGGGNTYNLTITAQNPQEAAAAFEKIITQHEQNTHRRARRAGMNGGLHSF